jgi:hypothetical protein
VIRTGAVVWVDASSGLYNILVEQPSDVACHPKLIVVIHLEEVERSVIFLRLLVLHGLAQLKYLFWQNCVNLLRWRLY